jgi:hypothetical protein
MRNVVIADFTRTYDYLVEPVCRALITRAATQSPPAELIAVVKPDQERIVKSAGIVRTQIDATGEPSATVGTLLVALSDAHVTVASHNRPLLGMVSMRGAQPLHINDLAAPFRPAVAVSSNQFNYGHPRPAASPRGTSWTYDHISSREHALDVMTQALKAMRAEGRSRAVLHVDIRPEMARVDPAFRGKAIQTNSVGMMSMLLEDAERRGLIRQEILSAKSRLIWLAAEAGRDASPSVPDPADVPPRASLETAGDVQRQESDLNGATTRVSTEGVVEDVQKPAEETPRARHRSEAWGDIPRLRKMGAFADARPRVYPHLEKQRGQPLAPAIAKAIAVARTELTSRQPWPDIQEFFERNLIRLDLVVWEEPPKTSKDAAFTRIKEFKAEWTVAIDAEIIFTVLNEVKWIEGNLQDRRDLARVLYRNSTEDYQAKAWAALQYLVKARRIVEDESGFSVSTGPQLSSTPASSNRDDQTVANDDIRH